MIRPNANAYREHLALHNDADLLREAKDRLKLAALASGHLWFQQQVALILDECKRRGRLHLYGQAYEEAILGRKS